MKARFLILVLAAIAVGIFSLAGADSGSPRSLDQLAPRDASGLDADDDDSSDDVTPCEEIAKIARKACKSDVRDDYLTQTANCLNLNDPAEAEECEEEAEEIRAEESELCRDRLDARLDLCDLLEEERYDPEIDPEDFVSPEEAASDPNPYFPLVPGNTWVYENEEETITVIVTDDTVEIMDVTCVVVRDLVTLTEDGEEVEDTDDWYAQDVEGNVWYFGEIAKNFEDGRLSDLEGSWTGGEDFAKPGMLLPADPFPGQVYRQEFFLREAEDAAMVVSVSASESTDLVDCDGNCLQTLEFNPMEPDVAEHKFYLPGVGLILEVDLENGDRTELVSFVDASMP